MLALNVSCTVCRAVFINSDAIYSTSCGHIFHFTCLNQWRAKSTSCPQCRSYNPTSYRIYLNFEDTADYEKTVQDLRAKLQSSNAKMDETKQVVKQKEQKIDELKRLYNISEQWRAELQNKIQKLSHELQVKNVNHAEELTMKLNEIQSLKTRNETVERAAGVHDLCEKISKLEEDLKHTTNRLTAEKSRLKEHLNEEEASKITLNYKIELLEQRLQHVTLELKKQIEENVNRSMDRIITVPTPTTPPEKNTKVSKAKKQHDIKRNTAKSQTLLTKQNSNLENAQNVIPPANNINTIPEISQRNLKKVNKTIKRWQQFGLIKPNDCKVIIKEFPLQDLVHPLTNTVIELAAKMSLTLRTENIKKVSILEQKNIAKNPNTSALLVEFNCIEATQYFLSNRKQLKYNLSTKSIQVKKYINEDIYPVFTYANRLLRANGYEYIVCKDNQVIAKKNRHDIAEKTIKTRNDVDRILGRTISQKPNANLSRVTVPNFDSLSDFDYYDCYDQF